MAVDTNRIRVNLRMDDGVDWDEALAADILDQVEKLVIPITSEPIPDAADPVIITATKRAYLNHTGATTMAAGPYSASFPAGGVYLTVAERGALQRAINQGNHFSIEMLPATYDAAP
jgi:hypothetical protein